jgi:putative flippase GtrA
MLKRLASREVIRFLLAGGFAAAANIGSRMIFSLYMSFELSIILAYCVGLSVAFTLMHRFVFERSERSLNTQLLRFIAVNLAALVQIFIISWGLNLLFMQLTDNDLLSETAAHTIGVLVPAFTSYLAHKYFTFR